MTEFRGQVGLFFYLVWSAPRQQKSFGVGISDTAVGRYCGRVGKMGGMCLWEPTLGSRTLSWEGGPLTCSLASSYFFLKKLLSPL